MASSVLMVLAKRMLLLRIKIRRAHLAGQPVKGQS
jgi:hypothetical protein